MQCFLSLKAGLKRIRSGIIIRGIFLVLTTSALFPADSYTDRFAITDDGLLVLISRPERVPEELIQTYLESGYKSEIYTSFRVQMSGSSLSIGGEHLEIHIRKTGFRDQITGDYILLLNDREIGVYRSWDDFFRAFSSLLVYPSGLPVKEGFTPSVKVRVRVIYKKLVTPFSLLYLLPGKYIDAGRWKEIHQGGLP